MLSRKAPPIILSLTGETPLKTTEEGFFFSSHVGNNEVKNSHLAAANYLNIYIFLFF